MIISSIEDGERIPSYAVVCIVGKSKIVGSRVIKACSVDFDITFDNNYDLSPNEQVVQLYTEPQNGKT